MVEPEIAFADLSANADLAESFLKFILTAVLNERGDDMKFFADRIDKGCVARVESFVGSTFERMDWPRAHAQFAEATRRAPGNDVLFYNLGLIYSGNGLFDEALAFYERSNEINPRHIASASRVRPVDKVNEMRAEVLRLKPIEQRLAEGLPVRSGPEYHRAMAERLLAAGEEMAANGHRLRALTAPS